jgi:nitroreductase
MTTNSTDLSFLTDHCSIPAADLVEPAPNAQQLEAILQTAMSAPDHGALTPFRFLVIESEARESLSAVFADAAAKRQLDPAGIAKQRAKPLRAPMIICVVAKLTESPKIPEIEQILSAGCAAQHIQLACRQMGFGSIWLTGDNCYDQLVYQALGLEFNERLVGFIYVGSKGKAASTKQRGLAKGLTEQWLGPRQASQFAI